MARGRQFARELVRFRQAEQRRIGGLLLRLIFSRGFAQRRGGFLDVQDVVGHLKGPADLLAEARAAAPDRLPRRLRQSRPDTTEARISAAVFER